MTVSKAYSILERDGIVELVRGQGHCASNHRGHRPTARPRRQAIRPLLIHVAQTAPAVCRSRRGKVLAQLQSLLEEDDHE